MKLLSNQQRPHQVNTEQLFESYRAALKHAASYSYGMRWKKVRQTEYQPRDLGQARAVAALVQAQMLQKEVSYG